MRAAPSSVACRILALLLLTASTEAKLTHVLDESMHLQPAQDQLHHITMGAQYEEYAIAEVSNRWAALSKAIRYYEAAAGEDGDHSLEAFMSLGRLYASVGRLEEALLQYNNAVTAATDLTDKSEALAEKAKLLVGMSRGEEAVELLLTALKYNNLNLNPYLPLVLVYKEFDSLSQGEWTSLIRRVEVTLEQQVRKKGILGDSESGYSSSNSVGRDVFWALFEAYDKIGEYANAWRYLEKAHKYVVDFQSRKSRTVQSSPRDSLISEDILLAHILGNLSSDIARDSRRWEDRSAVIDPIFVVGMPRSGAEAASLILCSHVDVFCDGEDSIFSGLEYSMLKRDIVATFLGADDESAAGLVGNVIRTFRENFMNRTYGQLGGHRYHTFKKLFIDTALSNFRNIRLIKLVFPGAIFVHVVRDPMDTLLSCFRYQYHNFETAWATTGADLLEEYVGYLKIMNIFRQGYPESILEVSYEALFHDTEEVIKTILKFIGGSWDDASGTNIIPYNNSVLYSFATKHFLRVGSEFRRHGIGSWKNYFQQTSHIRENTLKKLSILHGSKAMVSFAGSLNWDISFDYDYNTPPNPGIIFPVKKKSTTKDLKTKKDTGTRVHIRKLSNISSMTVSTFPAGKSVLQGTQHCNARGGGCRLRNEGKQAKISKLFNFPTLVSRLRAPHLVATEFEAARNYDLQNKIAKKSLPASRKKKQLMMFYNRTVLSGPHALSVMASMKSLLELNSAQSRNTSGLIDDIIASIFCYLVSTLPDRGVKASTTFTEVLPLISKDKRHRSEACLVHTGIALAAREKARDILAYVKSAKFPAVWLPVLTPIDISAVTNLLISRGELKEAARIIRDSLSWDLYGQTPSRLLTIQAAVLYIKMGRHDVALKHIEKAVRDFPGMLQARLLKAEIYAATGLGDAAMLDLDEVMLEEGSIMSDKYIDDNIKTFNVDQSVSSIESLLLIELSAETLAVIAADCTPEKRKHSLPVLSYESSISFEQFRSYVLLLSHRGGLLKIPEYFYVLSLVSTSTDIYVKLLAALSLYHASGNRISKALAYLSRLSELFPDDVNIIKAVARNRILDPNEYMAVLNMLDHVLLSPGAKKCKHWFHREVLYYWGSKLDVALDSLEWDSELSALSRQGAQCEDLAHSETEDFPSVWNASALTILTSNVARKKHVVDLNGQIGLDGQSNHEFSRLLNFSLKVANYTTLYPTFSGRQFAAIGIAAIEVSHVLRRHKVSLTLNEDTAASPADSARKVSIQMQPNLSHTKLLGIAAKWIQFIDIFEPIVHTSECTRSISVRNEKYDEKAFKQYRDGVIRDLYESSLDVSKSQIRDLVMRIKNSDTVKDLCFITGVNCSQDVELYVPSLARKDTLIPGPSLRVVEDSGHYSLQYDTACGTLSAPLYVTELEFIFERIIAGAVYSVHSDEFMRLALEFFYYFIRLFPFMTGNIEVGLAVMSGILLLAGEIIQPIPIPVDQMSTQFEWEALLCDSPQDFIEGTVDLFTDRIILHHEDVSFNIMESRIVSARDILEFYNLTSK